MYNCINAHLRFHFPMWRPHNGWAFWEELSAMSDSQRTISGDFFPEILYFWPFLSYHVSAEPLPCTPRLTVTQIVYMQSSTNTQVGFKIPAWSLILGWFWFSSQPDLWFLVGFDFPPTLIFDFWLVLVFLPAWSLIFGRFWFSSQSDLCQPSDLLYPDKPADGLEGRLRMARWRFSKLKGFVFMNSDQFLSSMQPSGSSLRQPIPSPVWLLLHQRCKKVFKFESRTCSGCGIQWNRNILKS